MKEKVKEYLKSRVEELTRKKKVLEQEQIHASKFYSLSERIKSIDNEIKKVRALINSDTNR